jgi:hypothetical protein
VNDWYTIRPAAQISKCLEVFGGSAEACTTVVLAEQAKTTSAAQLWRLTPEGYFESQLHPEFKMTLAIKDGNLVNSPSLYLYPKLNGDTQKWFFDENGRLISDASRTQALEVNAKGEFKFSPINLTLVTQKWKLCPSDVRPIPTDITDKWCFIQCDEYSHLVLEVKNSGKADGTGIGGNQLVGTDNQIWRLTKQGRLESKLKAGFYLQYKDLASNESLEMTSRTDLVNEVKWTFNISEGVLACAKDPKAVMDMFTSLDYKADELRRIGMQSKNGRDNQKWTFIPTDSV